MENNKDQNCFVVLGDPSFDYYRTLLDRGIASTANLLDLQDKQLSRAQAHLCYSLYHYQQTGKNKETTLIWNKEKIY